MSSSSNNRRTVSNLVGAFFSSSSFFLFFLSIFFLFIYKSSSWPYYLLFGSLFLNYSITVYVSVGLINLNKRSDLFIILYLLVFLIFPYVGILIYFLLGFDSIHLYESNKEEVDLDDYELSSSDHRSELVSFRTFNYNKIKNSAVIHYGANIVMLDSAIQILEEITNLIKNAKYFIHMEFYLFCDGLIFNHIFFLFEQKRKQNVEIKLIVDDIGSRGRLSRNSVRKLKNIGVEVKIFNPLFKRSDLWWQFRNHNKVLIVDNEYALIGSCNISDEYFNIANKYFQTTELSAKLTGSIVNSCTSMFLSHWNLCCGRKVISLENRDFYFRKLSYSIPKNKTIAQFLNNSPVKDELIIKDNLMQLIFNAKKSIFISTPYFFPPKDLINALQQASVSGVSIKILVPKNPDFLNFFRTLNRQLFSVLLNQNIEIYEYFGFNHEKLMIVDEEIVYFGSYNWDYRALYLNFETALLIQCKNIASSMCQFMDRQLKNSHRIYYSDLVKSSKNLVYLFFSSFIRIFKPFL